MADVLPPALEHEISSIKNILWGSIINYDIFRRWSQSFYFSNSERSALEQTQGGPCCIIAPVQSFIFKNLLQQHDKLDFRDQITDEKQTEMLQTAFCQILEQCASNKFCIAYLKPFKSPDESDVSNGDINETFNPALRSLSEAETFHANLGLKVLHNRNEFHSYIKGNIHTFKKKYGCLLFLYSVIATKSVDQLKIESDTNEPLIDSTYGYGSQSLINLMITGKGVNYVWDHEQDIGGLKLTGLDKQSIIGFITLMEHLGYCPVGLFYKNPVYPIWVLGSETHLTVLFSFNKKLVSPETQSEKARRVFKNFDKDGNNFINADCLQEVLSELDLVSDEGYVNIMRKRLDSENLGIILLNSFMDEFFPKEESSTPDSFQLIHYNGLAQSNEGGQVKYRVGEAVLLESDLRSMCDSNPMLTCLQTKWPSIDVTWEANVTPSLN